MKPGKLDLPTIWRGCDWGPVILKWKDQDGQPMNLSGLQIIAQSLNINLNPSIDFEAGVGVTKLVLDRNQTANLKLGTENWDWIFEGIAGQSRYPPFLAGKVEVKDPISRHLTDEGVIGPPPENDNFADAIRITGLNGSMPGTNINATRETGEPSGESTVWYFFTPVGFRTVTLQIGMDWLTIGVFTGPDVSHLTRIAQSSGNPMMVSFPASPGVTYWIRLAKRTRESAFTLIWHITSRPPPP